jgi:hypothetical protein
MGRCPWYGEECRCGGVTALTSADPHRGRFAPWQTIDGKCPPGCEAHVPLEVVGAYRGQVSDAKWAEYEAMLRQGKQGGADGAQDEAKPT